MIYTNITAIDTLLEFYGPLLFVVMLAFEPVIIGLNKGLSPK